MREPNSSKAPRNKETQKNEAERTSKETSKATKPRTQCSICSKHQTVECWCRDKLGKPQGQTQIITFIKTFTKPTATT
jgi:hypothetical protein